MFSSYGPVDVGPYLGGDTRPSSFTAIAYRGTFVLCCAKFKYFWNKLP